MASSTWIFLFAIAVPSIACSKSPCSDYCAKQAEACPSVTESDCKDLCDLEMKQNDRCSSQIEARDECWGGGATFTCEANGAVSTKGCDAESKAASDCIFMR